MKARSNVMMALVCFCLGLAAVPTELCALWTMSSPADCTTRGKGVNVAANGMGPGNVAGKFLFGKLNTATPPKVEGENEVAFQVGAPPMPNMAGVWSTTLSPPSGGAWTPSPGQHIPGMCDGDHYAWVEENNTPVEVTTHHFVEP